MESSPLHLLFLLGYCLAVIEGELRCHCNESGCVATGYMCKSRAGQCFTALEVRGEITHLTHGCLDSLSEQHQAQCQLADPATTAARTGSAAATSGKASRTERSDPSPVALASSSSDTDSSSSSSGSAGDNSHADGNNRSSSSSNLSAGVHHHQQLQQQQQQQRPSAPILVCCTEDMCNYRENADITVNLLSKLNASYHRGSATQAKESSVYARDHHSARRRNDHADRDLWFKAAVIAVPIAGGFILVLLVLLAVRMLRSDSNRHRRLLQMRRERSLTKAHMYISEHFMGRNSSSLTGVASKLQQCSLFDEKLRPPRTSYSLCSDKTPSSLCSAHGSGVAGGVVGDNVTNMSSITCNSSTTSSSSKGGVTPLTVCCTDDSPCCGGLCSVRRETQVSQCETCIKNTKRLSRGNNASGDGNSSNCCSKGCHASPTDGTSDSSQPFSDIKPPISSYSKSGERKTSTPNIPTQSSDFIPDPPNPVHQKPCAFFSDSKSPSPTAMWVSSDNQPTGDAAAHGAFARTCDRNSAPAHSRVQHQHLHHQLQQPPSQQQTQHNQHLRTIVAHWEKTNPRRPMAIL